MSDDNTLSPDLRDLRTKASRVDATEQRNAELERQLLFARAGVDTDPATSRLGSMLFITSQATTVEAVQAEAREIGLLKATEAPAPAVPVAEQAQQQFRQQLAVGAPALPDTNGADPYDTVYAQFHKDMKSGVSRDRAQLGAIDGILTAAAKGDKRVFFNQDAWLQRGLEEDALPTR